MSNQPYPDIGAGEGVRIAWESEDLKFACCDCNLVHRLEFRVEGNEVIISGWRDNRATAQLRRQRGIPIAGKKIANPSSGG